MERKADHEIEPLFLRRWSPRAMDGKPLSEADLRRLFEAARWAPSSGNNQPWRFVYGRASTESFDRLFNLLGEGNKPWCARAGALLVVMSKKTLENGRPARTHSFDTGAAWMSLALQATESGLVVHGMAGFDYDRARADLAVPDDYDVEAMVALGHPGRLEDLEEKYQAREVKSGRKPIGELASEGKFPPV
jgi:nitroreductase